MPKRNVPISIIIPTYNRATTIGKTIDSFIAQDYSNWEMLVVDDYSQDNTREVIEQYNRRDSRIHYLSNERKKGAQGARNTGILHAKSEWVVLFDSDDYAYPNFLEKMIDATDDNSDVITCNVSRYDVNTHDRVHKEWGKDGRIEHDLMTGLVYINFDNSLIRKERLKEIGLLDESCPSHQELDTHIRLSKESMYKHIPIELLDYYWGGLDTMSVNDILNVSGYCYVLMRNKKRYKEVIGTNAYMKLVRSWYRKADKITRSVLRKNIWELYIQLPIMKLMDWVR